MLEGIRIHIHAHNILHSSKHRHQHQQTSFPWRPTGCWRKGSRDSGPVGVGVVDSRGIGIGVGSYSISSISISLGLSISGPLAQTMDGSGEARARVSWIVWVSIVKGGI